MGQPSWAQRIRQVKEAIPIESVVGQYFTLDPEGSRYLRAREHDSLVVDRLRGRYHWNARGESGDVVDFLCRQEGLSLAEAIDRLGEQVLDPSCRAPRPTVARPRQTREPQVSRPSVALGRRMLKALRVAVDVYHATLLEHPAALAYLTRRGIDAATVRRLKLGFCAGDRLLAALQIAGIPTADARRVGLLARGEQVQDRDGTARGPLPAREFLVGRIVVPEIGPAGPTWLIGRVLSEEDGPRYLSLPLARPLLGYHRVRASPVVLVTEGVFDLLTLLAWGLPGVALCGTHPGPRALAQLRRLAATSRLYLVPQADQAGRLAAERVAALLSVPPPIIALPSGVKDLSELAGLSGGCAAFCARLPPEVVLRADEGGPRDSA